MLFDSDESVIWVVPTASAVRLVVASLLGCQVFRPEPASVTVVGLVIAMVVSVRVPKVGALIEDGATLSSPNELEVTQEVASAVPSFGLSLR